MKFQKCIKCKMEIPKGAQTCHHCGAKQGMGCGTLIGVVIIALFVLSIVGRILPSEKDSSNDRPSKAETSASEPVMSKAEYISKCQHISYADLARNPDKYRGKLFTFTGQVIQVMEPTFGDTVSLRINVTEGEYLWSDTIYAEVEIPGGADRILEDDIITIYGECDGLYSYESILGQKVSLPKIDIAYYSVSSQQ